MSDIEKKLVQNAISDAFGLVATARLVQKQMGQIHVPMEKWATFDGLAESLDKLADYLQRHNLNLNDIKVEIFGKGRR